MCNSSLSFDREAQEKAIAEAQRLGIVADSSSNNNKRKKKNDSNDNNNYIARTFFVHYVYILEARVVGPVIQSSV